MFNVEDEDYDINNIYHTSNDVAFLLRQRAKHDKIYTWAGPVLLAVNPMDKNLNLYSEEYQKMYGQYLEAKNLEPHVYSVATRAQYGLVEKIEKINQAIVLDGDKGSGKTFNARKIIEFLGAMEKKIFNLIEDVLPLLDALTTGKNPASLNHGQLYRLEYENGIISGASIQAINFQATRVTNATDNFSIFYQCLAGFSDEEMKELKLCRDEKYDILLPVNLEQWEIYKNEFSRTVRALEILRLSEQTKKEIFQVLAIILHLGNIKFREICHLNLINFEDEYSLRAFENICLLTNVTEDQLEIFLTTAPFHPDREEFTVYCRYPSRKECHQRLFSLMRHLYDKLFHWLVDKINEILSCKKSDCDSITVLESFSFDCMHENNLEQLCTNYAVERMRLNFLEKMIKERELIEEELNDFLFHSNIEANRCRVRVIEDDLFRVINEVCYGQTTFYDLEHHQVIPESAKSVLSIRSGYLFCVNHFSKRVEYFVRDIIEKNTNFQGTILINFKNKLLQLFLNTNDKEISSGCTIVDKIKSDLDTLIKHLDTCSIQYIKCLQSEEINGFWFYGNIRKQLVYSGILDTWPFVKWKFPLRMSVKRFSKTYLTRLPINEQSNFREQCLWIVEDLRCPKDSVYVGSHMIHFTYEVFSDLVYHRTEVLKMRTDRSVESSNCEEIDKLDVCTDFELWKRDIIKWINNTSSDEKWEEFLSDENTRKNQVFKNCQVNSITFQSIFSDSTSIKWSLDESRCIISWNNCRLFYQNGILSRRRLAEFPIRFHTRSTCLPGSHNLPRSELPSGLQDCL